MAAFVIFEQTATIDREKLDAYRKSVHTTIAQYGGRVLGGGVPKAVEGEIAAERMVVIEFESLDKANAWYGSPEYARIKALRHEGARGNLVFVG